MGECLICSNDSLPNQQKSVRELINAAIISTSMSILQKLNLQDYIMSTKFISSPMIKMLHLAKSFPGTDKYITPDVFADCKDDTQITFYDRSSILTSGTAMS